MAAFADTDSSGSEVDYGSVIRPHQSYHHRRSTARRTKVNHLPRRHLRDRLANFDTSGLTCQIGADYGGDSSSRHVSHNIIDFYYAVGSNVTIDSRTMNQVEGNLFRAAQSSILWCYGRYDDNDNNDAQEEEASETEVDDEKDQEESSRQRRKRRKRKLQSAEQQRQQIIVAPQHKRKERIMSAARKLGIIAINSAPPDIDTKRECPEKVRDMAESTGTIYCRAYEGQMLILARSNDDVSYMIAGMRDGLQNVMADGSALGENIPNVTFLSYLGDTEQEAFGPVGGSGGSFPVALATTIPVFLVLLLVTLVSRRWRKMITASHSEKKSSPFVMVGTGDPPGSLHDGLYHYLPCGTRYLSTRCYHCQETRKNSFYTAGVLGTILEEESYIESERNDDDDDDDDRVDDRGDDDDDDRSSEESQDERSRFIYPDLSRPGSRHSRMDVHRCNSATCTRCNPRIEQQTMFVPSDIVLHSEDYFSATSSSSDLDEDDTSYYPARSGSNIRSSK